MYFVLEKLEGRSMQKPNLDRMWETFIKIGLPREITYDMIIQGIRIKIQKVVKILMENDIADWYHFLIHDKDSGVPTNEDDNNFYFHIRFSVKKNTSSKDVYKILPNYCKMTHHIEHRLESITGIDKSIVKNEEIEEVWRIIGEQSEWVIRMLNIHTKNARIPPHQVRQFLHFFANMTQMQVR